MGYQMVYQPAKTVLKRDNSFRIRTMVAASLLLFSLAVRAFWNPGTEMLREILLPGNLSVTEKAFSALMDDLREGEDFGGAIEVFCRSVLNGEN